MEEKVFKKVKPCGILNCSGKLYWLLNPEPVAKDSWQGDNVYRWVAVPMSQMDKDGRFSYARHVVSNCFTVDYIYNAGEIEVEIQDMGEYDLGNLELHEAEELNG